MARVIAAALPVLSGQTERVRALADEVGARLEEPPPPAVFDWRGAAEPNERDERP